MVVKKHLLPVHGYAFDTQLYVSFRPDSFATQDQAIKAIENVRARLVSHRLIQRQNFYIGSSQQLCTYQCKSRGGGGGGSAGKERGFDA